MILAKQGTNWIWYVDVTVNEMDDIPQNVKVNRSWRLHRQLDDNHPADVGHYDFIETRPGKIVMMIIIILTAHNGRDHLTLPVFNPMYIFDYPS